MRTRAAAALLGAAGLALALLLARATGVTYDEPPYLAFSWAYLHGGPGPAAREYPPVLSYLRGAALAAAGASRPLPPPELARGTVEPHAFGQLFLFYNAVPAGRLLLWGRVAGLACWALLLGSAWLWAGAAQGAEAALFTLAFAALDPDLLAHASLATTDAGLAAFFTAAVALWACGRGRGAAWAAAAGAAAGLALGSKATGAILPAVFGAAALWTAAVRGRLERDEIRDVAVAAAVCLAAAALAYAPTGLGGLAGMLGFRAAQMAEPAPTYLFGRAWPHGHPLYFPAVLAVKTTLPLLGLGLWGLLDERLWRGREEHRRAALAAAGLLLLAAMSARRQLGVRYVLALYPLLALGAGAAAAALRRRGGRAAAAALLALAWHAGSSLAALPEPLAYVNEAFGGPAAAYRLVGDSNVDWGQGLPELRAFLEKRPGGLILSYFGRDCPSRLGLRRQDAFSTPGPCPPGELLPADIGREWLAVSATKRQGFYESGPPAWGWLDGREPDAVVGRSILLYNVSRDPDAHERLARMYAASGQAAAAAREAARARRLRALPANESARP